MQKPELPKIVAVSTLRPLKPCRGPYSDLCTAQKVVGYQQMESLQPGDVVSPPVADIIDLIKDRGGRRRAM